MSHLSDIEIAQAKKLAHITTIAKKIGVKEKVDKPMSLADIYYYNDNNINKKDKPTIGFITNKK